MLIELPSLALPPSPSSTITEYTMDDYRDLFVDDSDQETHFGAKGVSTGVGVMNAMDGLVSDPESGICTTSESELDVENKARRFMAPPSVPSLPRELALHSPGKLLGTPRDPSRRYEYPFPPSTPSYSSSSSHFISSEAASSLLTPASTTPALTPPLHSPAALVSHTPTSSLGLHTLPAQSSPSLSPFTFSHTYPHLTPLRTSSPPLPLVGAAGLVAHPKLLRFKPADAPVPPKLRNRSGSGALSAGRTPYSVTVPSSSIRE